jgi:hypothetical protein
MDSFWNLKIPVRADKMKCLSMRLFLLLPTNQGSLARWLVH